MNTVTIRTPQNVLIEYEAATLMERVIAQIIDTALMGMLAFFLFMAGITVFTSSIQTVLIVLVALLFTFATLLCELYGDGMSIGKRLLKIQVKRLDGQELKLNDVLSRWAFSFLEIYLTFGTLAVFMIQVSQKKQRMGDLVATTTVIKRRASYLVTLENVKNRKSAEDYTPTYPGVERLKEEQMLILKSTLDRYEKYKNEGHQEALLLLTKHVCQVLNVPVPKKNKAAFLKQILKDYVILTR